MIVGVGVGWSKGGGGGGGRKGGGGEGGEVGRGINVVVTVC